MPLMPDREIIFQRLYSVEGMLSVLAERVKDSADVSTAEMAWGISDYMAHVREDVQALVYALEGRQTARD